MAALVRHGLDACGLVSSVRVDGAAAATPMHAHRSLILGLVDAGSRSLMLADATLSLNAGDGFVIPPDVPHAFAATAEGSHRVVAIDPLALPFPDWSVGAIRDDVWSAAFGALHLAVEAGEGDTVALAKALGHETDRLRPRALQSRTLAGQVRKARRVACGALDRPLELADIAEMVGLSPFHLHRLYRTTYGLTPAEHRLEARLRLARQLILDGNAIADVAATLGFADQSHLSRTFRRLMGVPPGLWARQVGQRMLRRERPARP